MIAMTVEKITGDLKYQNMSQVNISSANTTVFENARDGGDLAASF